MAQITSNLFKVRILPAPTVPGVPAWVPPPGFFADVPMTNMPADLTPAIYAGNNYAMRKPFDIWGGGAVLRDFGPLGALAYYSGGHENSVTEIQVGFSLICDFSSLTWYVRNVPSVANPLNVFVDGVAPDGSLYCFHTYLGLQEMPAAWGGGPKGSLVAMFYSDPTSGKHIHVLDVSQPTLGYSRMKTDQFQNADRTKIRFQANGTGSQYPITVMDEKRQGYWAAVTMAADYTLFIHKSGLITQHPSLGGNLQDGSMILCDSMNLLVALDGGYATGYSANGGYRNLIIRDLVSGETSYNKTVGVVPAAIAGYDYDGTDNYHAPGKIGLQWVEELGCAVGLDTDRAEPAVFKLTPPATNPKTNPWTWSIVPLAHWPTDSGGQAALQKSQNSTWSKFRWIPSLKAFVYGSAADRRPQVIKLS